MHAYFLAQQDVRKKYNKHNKLEDTVLVKIKAIPEETSNKKELATRKKLEALQLDLSKKIDCWYWNPSFSTSQCCLLPSIASGMTSPKSTASQQAGSTRIMLPAPCSEAKTDILFKSASVYTSSWFVRRMQLNAITCT